MVENLMTDEDIIEIVINTKNSFVDYDKASTEEENNITLQKIMAKKKRIESVNTVRFELVQKELIL